MFEKLTRTFVIICIVLVLCSCNQERLQQVTTSEFKEFVDDTGYVTDAEKYGWSFVQTDIINYEVLHGIDWRCPTGRVVAQGNDPVTQVSYNDALAYAAWSKTTIPGYESYWQLVDNDKRPINFASHTILPLDQVNILGNVWELTSPGVYGNIRLAGGSYLCDINTCNGTSKERELLVDKETANSHIGFVVIQ